MTRKSGYYALKSKGVRSLPSNDRRRARALRRQLATPEGVKEALLTRATMSSVVVGVVEQQIGEAVSAGEKLETVPLFRFWPTCANTARRDLALLHALYGQDGNGDTDEIGRIRRTLGAQAAVQQQNTPEEDS